MSFGAFYARQTSRCPFLVLKLPLKRRSRGGLKRMFCVKAHHPHALPFLPLQTLWEHTPAVQPFRDALLSAVAGAPSQLSNSKSASNGILAARWFPVTHTHSLTRTHTHEQINAGFCCRGAPADRSACLNHTNKIYTFIHVLIYGKLTLPCIELVLVRFNTRGNTEHLFPLQFLMSVCIYH